MIQRDPDLRMREGHHYDLTRAEDREQTMRQIARTIELKKTIKDPRLRQALFTAMAFYSESYSMRMYVHDMLFKQALMLFGTSEQQDKWMDDIENWRVIGCFAMVRETPLPSLVVVIFNVGLKTMGPPALLSVKLNRPSWDTLPTCVDWRQPQHMIVPPTSL
jgi:hypothetical protein